MDFLYNFIKTTHNLFLLHFTPLTLTPALTPLILFFPLHKKEPRFNSLNLSPFPLNLYLILYFYFAPIWILNPPPGTILTGLSAPINLLISLFITASLLANLELNPSSIILYNSSAPPFGR